MTTNARVILAVVLVLLAVDLFACLMERQHRALVLIAWDLLCDLVQRARRYLR